MANYDVTTYSTGIQASIEEAAETLEAYLETLDENIRIIKSGVEAIGRDRQQAVGWCVHDTSTSTATTHYGDQIITGDLAVTGSVSAGLMDITSPHLRSFRRLFLIPAWFVRSTTSGTGETSAVNHRIYLKTGATADSVAELGTTVYPGFSPGAEEYIIDWSRPLGLRLCFASISAAASSPLAYILLGCEDNVSIIGGPSDKAIGLKILGSDLYGIAHDGADLDTVDLGVTLEVRKVVDMMILSDGAGNVSFYQMTPANPAGALVGASTGGPTGDSTSNFTTLRYAIKNPSDATDRTFRGFHTELILEA